MKVHYSSKSSEWETPQAFFEELNREFKFVLDVCASPQNKKCKTAYFDSALVLDWGPGPAWMNPPYGRTIGSWIEKAHEESVKGVTVVCLIPARTDTAWWHDYVMLHEIRYIRGRLYFTDDNGNSGRAPFPSAVVIMRPR